MAGTPSGWASLWECRAARSRQARAEGAQGASWGAARGGTAKGGTITSTMLLHALLNQLWWRLRLHLRAAHRLEHLHELRAATVETLAPQEILHAALQLVANGVAGRVGGGL